jgi:uncharacterized protein (TIGR03435 family)
VLVAALVAATTLSAAARQTSRPAFDVVSIKPTSLDTPGLIKASPQRIEIPNTTLMGLIRTAYSRFAFDMREIVGGPSWIDADRFAIIATAAAPFKTGPDGFPLDLTAMMRTLIEDRFKVKVHEEQRDMPHYALVLARPDRKTGQGLTSVPDECSQAIKELSGAKPAPRRPGPPPCSFGGPPGKLIATGVTLNAFANVLSRSVGKQVLDRTGLPGSFNIELTFDPTSAAALGPPGANPGPPIRDDTAPSIFTALQEQLGLKLESTRGPVDVLVVDAAEPPTPN